MAQVETRRLGRYELLLLLGQGGMGEVHLAKLSGAGGFEKLCIVKTILPQMKADPQFVERFHHEARVLVQLTHSSIAQVYDMGEADGTLYMAIEYVAGVDLARVESRVGHGSAPMPLPMALYIGRELAEALGYAHRKAGPDGVPLGIVHRDVSPQNVMVSYEGEVKVIDFGLAKSAGRSQHTMPSTVMGKLGYMSPEQAMAQAVDSRSDLYSAGIVVWEMLAGQRLFNGGTMAELLAQMANPTIPSLQSVRREVSPELDQVVQRALAKRPEERFPRAEDFARALNELAVREGASIGAEEVGILVRTVCPEEFAAERKLQSQLSVLRKKGSSSPAVAQQPVSGIDGTFVRGSEGGMTPAQRALSVVATPQPQPPQAEVAVRKSKGPIALALVLLALAGTAAGYFALSGGGSKPAVVEPLKLPEHQPEKLPEIALTTAAVEPPGSTEAPAAPVDAGPAQPRALVEVSGKVFKVLTEDGRRYILLGKGDKLAAGDRLRLVGEPKGNKRELLTTAAVLWVRGSLATLILEEEAALPESTWAVRDTSGAPVAARAEHSKRTPDAGSGAKLREEQLVAWPGEKPPPEPQVAPPPPPMVAAMPPVAPAQPPVTPPAPAAPPANRGIVLSGKLQVNSGIFGKSVLFFNSNRFILSGCEIRLPNGRTHRFGRAQVLLPREELRVSLDKFYVDNRPADPVFTDNYAVLDCREGKGKAKVFGDF